MSLNDLKNTYKVGEYVNLQNRYNRHMVRVEKVTPTGIVRLEGFPHLSFRPDGGQRGESGFNRYRIRGLTEKDLNYFEHRGLYNKLVRINMYKLNKSTLEGILSLIEKERENGKPSGAPVAL